MKKLIAIFLMLMLVVSSASAAEWGEGMSPSKPFIDMDDEHAADLEKTVGYWVGMPNGLAPSAGVKTVFIYLPREDVRAGIGQVKIISDDQGEEWSVAMNDTNYVNVRPMIESELTGLFWGSGTCFEIMLPMSLRLGRVYTIDMEEQCIIANVGNGIANPAYQWVLHTIGDYGVSELTYQNLNEDGEYVNKDGDADIGDRLRFDLVLGGSAKSATLVVADNGEISFNNGTHFIESTEVTGDINVANPAWGVVFWDVEFPSGSEEEMEQHIVDELYF